MTNDQENCRQFFDGNCLLAVEQRTDDSVPVLPRRRLVVAAPQGVSRGTLLAVDRRARYENNVPALCQYLSRCGQAASTLIDDMYVPASEDDYVTKKMVDEQLYAELDAESRALMEAVARSSWSLHHPVMGNRGLAISPLLNAINHNCAPSAQLVHTFLRFRSDDDCDDDTRPRESNTVALYLYAANDLKFGDEITVSYVPFYSSTSQRRKQLLEQHGFKCVCVRCRQRGGYGNDRWITASSDSTSQHNSQDRAKIERMRKEYDSVLEEKPLPGYLERLDERRTEEQLSRWTSRLIKFTRDHSFLHKCHWRLWRLRSLLIEAHVVRQQYINALHVLRDQFIALAAVTDDYPCVEKMELLYRYRWIMGIVHKQNAEIDGINDSTSERAESLEHLALALFSDQHEIVEDFNALANMYNSNTVKASNENARHGDKQ